ncbi:hypothetical protein M3148_15465 [Georgenia satyanarayanai]|uniref:hypothetical protein n=1 Tax=Georgenia satyanarayanai TaxID=860221 RepID=UPI00203FBC41|nr:hypothetical protein [Georgenia satyanarayanai]MCM3662378.1 hypothetical protein [Georgenia satyanarayanai]
MSDDDPLLDSPLEAGFRAAHQALRILAPPNTVATAGDAYLPDIIDELEDLVRLARDTAAAHLGPTIRWVAPQPPRDQWAQVIVQVDLDGYSKDDPLGAFHIDDWEDSALARAGRAYRRECGWDFSPGEAGIWLLSVAPYSSMGGGDRTSWKGTLSGFAILHDRDDDGEYESLAHLWTAYSWRRRGVGLARIFHGAAGRGGGLVGVCG